MTFAEYLRIEGACAVGLGVVLIAIAAVLGDWDGPAWSLPAVAVVASAIAAVAARLATRAAVARARDTPPRMTAAAVRRQTLLETVAWAVAVAGWVAWTGESAELVAGTGVATIVFGAVRLTATVPAGMLVDRRRFVLGAEATTPG